MPSPYGRSRSASTYYQYGGVPQHYVLEWEGLPPGSSRAAESRALGNYYHGSILHSGPESSLGAILNLSRSEKQLAMVGALALVGWVAWKKFK